MRRLILLSLAGTICFIFISVESIFAEAELQKHTWELGTEISHIEYEEPGLMEEKGMMYGIVGSYTYHDKLMLKAEGRGSWGWVDYSSPISGTMNDIPDFMLELRGLGGYDFPIFTASTLTPYIGIGYRYLNDDMTGTTSTGALGYEREANYFYMPLGVEVITPIGENWLVGATLEGDIFIWGIQKSHYDYTGLPELVLENEQHTGYGFRGSLKVQKKGKKLDFIVEPYIRYWDIGISEISVLGYEPANNSTEVGVKLAVKF